MGEAQKQASGVAAPQMMIIPQSAVREDQGKQIVFLVKDNKTERRAVTLGGKRGSDAEVVAGVTAGDTVVVRGPDNLRDGQAVEIKK